MSRICKGFPCCLELDSDGSGKKGTATHMRLAGACDRYSLAVEYFVAEYDYGSMPALEA